MQMQLSTLRSYPGNTIRIGYELIGMTHNGAIAAVIQLNSRLKLNIYVAYNPLAESPYRWSTMEVKYLLDTLTTKKLEITADLIIVGDINLSDANWETSHSNDDYELCLLGLFVDMNLEQLLQKSGSSNCLDFVLPFNRNSIVSTETNLKLHKDYSLDGSSCPDHLPYVIQLDSTIAKVNPPICVQKPCPILHTVFNGLQRASTDLSKANLFNNYFASMFSEGDSAHYPGNISNPDLTGRMDITEKNVSAILEKLNPAKSHGPDAIPHRLLKNLATVLSPSLSRILSTCVSKGKFPEPWKTALFSPVHKGGNRSNIKKLPSYCSAELCLESVRKKSLRCSL